MNELAETLGYHYNVSANSYISLWTYEGQWLTGPIWKYTYPEDQYEDSHYEGSF